MPSYVINLKTAMAAPPCTGRFCSEEADVMHFNVRVMVAADQVMPFIQELCSAKTHKFRGWYGDEPEQTFKHNQITVLESTRHPHRSGGFRPQQPIAMATTPSWSWT